MLVYYEHLKLRPAQEVYLGLGVYTGGETWYTYWCMFHVPAFSSMVLLVEEILHHLGCIKPCDIHHISRCRISSINSIVRDSSTIVVLLLYCYVCWRSTVSNNEGDLGVLLSSSICCSCKVVHRIPLQGTEGSGDDMVFRM